MRSDRIEFYSRCPERMGRCVTDDPDTKKPGFGDLESPFLFVPHGVPEAVEWMRRHPGWVKFPATSGET